MFSYIQVNVYSLSMYILTVKTIFVNFCFLCLLISQEYFCKFRARSGLYNKSILIVKVFIRIALPDAPDSTQQVKRLVHQKQDSDAQNAIQSVTGRLFAVGKGRCPVNQRFITFRPLRGERRPSKGGVTSRLKLLCAVLAPHIANKFAYPHRAACNAVGVACWVTRVTEASLLGDVLTRVRRSRDDGTVHVIE